LIQYLPSTTDDPDVQLYPVIAPLPWQVRLLGSTHAPNRHWVLPVQALLQAPQLPWLDVGSMHALPQTICPGGQEHWLLAHVPPVGHALQPPQCCALAVMSTHWLPVPHGPSPVGHVHVLIQQDWSLAHALRHVPQFDEFPVVSTHEPPQSVSRAAQLATHCP
jgi:hypothetical protein